MDKIIEQDCLEYIDMIDLTPLKNKTVYISGANGLIGTYIVYMLHLANLLQSMNIKIIALSRNSPCDKLCNIFRDRYEFIQADLAAEKFPNLPYKADFIIHGATYAQPAKFLQNYSETIRLNIAATENFLKKAKQDGAKFLFLSSSEIYGNPDSRNIPTPEDYPGFCSPISIRSIYSEAKRMGETLCFCYKNFESVDAKIARISMTYGPGISVHDKRVMGQFISQALKNKKITMLDDGSKNRTFCYIADCVLMLLNVLIYGKDFIYNVGGIDRLTIRKLAETICSLTGSDLEVCPSLERVAKDIEVSPEFVELDIHKIINEFQTIRFKPFNEGIARTIEWNRTKINVV